MNDLDWWHTIEVSPGVVTPGSWDLRRTASRMPWPVGGLAGLRCLDVGTMDGFWAFELERRGAGEVMAIDLVDPGRQDVGEFDVVVMGYVLQMLRDPLRALEAVRSVCREHLLLLDTVSLPLSLLPSPLARLDARRGHLEWFVFNRRGLRLAARGGAGRVRGRGDDAGVPRHPGAGGRLRAAILGLAGAPRARIARAVGCDPGRRQPANDFAIRSHSMRLHRFTGATSAILVADALIFVTPTPAMAAVKPAVTLTLPARADGGSPIPYSFTAARVRRHDKLVIQRQTGTAKVYRNVTVLVHSASGSGSLPALALGSYQYRIAVLRKVHRKTKLVAGRTAKVSVFGDIPLAKLLNGDDGTYTTPTRTFPYVDQVFASSVTGSTVLTVAAHTNRCRSIHFDFVPERYSRNDPDDPITITVVQQSADPISASARPDDFGALDAPLVPGESWSLKTSVAAADQGERVDLNGSANCDRVAPFN